MKYFMYLLAALSDEERNDGIFANYLMVDALMSKRDDISFIENMKRGLNELFTGINKEAKSICEEHKIRITGVALTVPAIWTLKTLKFESIYRELFVNAFTEAYPDAGINPNSIVFLTESEALAHYIFQKHYRALHIDEKTPYILLLGLGGHSMVRLTNLPQLHLSPMPTKRSDVLTL